MSHKRRVERLESLVEPETEPVAVRIRRHVLNDAGQVDFILERETGTNVYRRVPGDQMCTGPK